LPPTIESSVPATCLAAGAQLTERDGRIIVALYGSVQGEIAACMKSVGLADRSDLGTLELRGETSLMDRALAAHLGDPPPGPGTARRLRSVWYLRLDARRALLVGTPPALASGRSIGKGRDRAELAHKDIGSTVSTISVIGPRVGRLLGVAGLPDDLAIGAVGRDPDDASVLAILREGQRRVLILVRRAAVDALWHRLLAAGEPLEAAFVGCDALALLDASSASTPG
jgi:glycine cleavage system aminomethyltransferase T